MGFTCVHACPHTSKASVRNIHQGLKGLDMVVYQALKHIVGYARVTAVPNDVVDYGEFDARLRGAKALRKSRRAWVLMTKSILSTTSCFFPSQKTGNQCWRSATTSTYGILRIMAVSILAMLDTALSNGWSGSTMRLTGGPIASWRLLTLR